MGWSICAFSPITGTIIEIKLLFITNETLYLKKKMIKNVNDIIRIEKIKRLELALNFPFNI
jgi:hypothetical protein